MKYSFKKVAQAINKVNMMVGIIRYWSCLFLNPLHLEIGNIQTQASTALAWEPHPNSDYSSSYVALVQNRVGLVRLGPSRTISGTGCLEAAGGITLSLPWRRCLSWHVRGRLDPAGHMGAASHEPVLPTSADDAGECAEDECSPYLKETEVEEMRRKGTPAWKNSCAMRRRKVELQHKGGKTRNRNMQ